MLRDDIARRPHFADQTIYIPARPAQLPHTVQRMDIAGCAPSDTPIRIHNTPAAGRAGEAERSEIGHHSKNFVLRAAAIMGRGLISWISIVRSIAYPAGTGGRHSHNLGIATVSICNLAGCQIQRVVTTRREIGHD